MTIARYRRINHIILPFAVKPRFTSGKLSNTFVVTEGETRNVSMKAEGNPPQISYKWGFPPEAVARSPSFYDRIHTSGPLLWLSNTQRTDRGNYTVLAWNGHGNFNTTASIFIDVLYPPRSVKLLQSKAATKINHQPSFGGPIYIHTHAQFWDLDLIIIRNVTGPCQIA